MHGILLNFSEIHTMFKQAFAARNYIAVEQECDLESGSLASRPSCSLPCSSSFPDSQISVSSYIVSHPFILKAPRVTHSQ